MCDCFHLAFPNWHAASGTGAGRRLRGPEAATQDDSTCDEPPQFTEGERPRPQGSSPVEEYPDSEKYTDSDKECEAEHDPHHKSGSGKKTKKSGLGSMFEKRSTSKMSKLKEVHSPESEVIVKTAKDGCAEGLIYGGGGKEGIFIKEVVPESPASKSLKLKEGDQILSATVYFDNVSYEDAVQILEHAQAYKLKLCLKRKPDIEETEHNIESDVIHEEGIYTPQMREQGKTKRRGDARISWPKFPSFGKGRKSRFTRSHSSSEADEQRKLELSPTTSDTESPIKSQDALKGKKKHKLKLSVLKKRGRVSSSEEQDTDAPTGQISSDTQQTQEFDLLSPECLESPSGAKPQVYVTEVLKVSGNLGLEQNNQTLTEAQTVQHGVELISIDSTLKTTDLTMALADQGSPSGTKSPDGKKKKKEKSELKIKILGKDKSHKKDGKAKSSPKRLKTLGASVEIADQAETEKSDIIPSFESHTKPALDANTQIVSIESSRQTPTKSMTTHVEMGVPQVELNISDVSLLQKSPQKGEDRTKKGKNIKQKEKQKQEPTFKLPKIGFGDIATEETIQKLNVNVEERTTKIEQFTTEGAEVKEDLYERLSKSSVSRAQLPKREDIEIPGMEDMSMRTTAKGRKEPKAVFTREYEDIQAETVQLSIDVDSVKEAVSKLPGFKLPKVDTSGVPIPEEITVIDANAQRISMKTPTKVADTRTKHEAHFMRFDITASPEISKTTIKQPKITPADLTSEELLIETKAGMKKTQKEHKSEPKPSNKEIKAGVFKREDITIPGKESLLQAQETAKTQRTERIILQYESGATKESDKKSKKAKISMASFGIAKPDMRIPDIGINLPQQNISETTSLQEVKKTEMKGKGQIDCDVKIPQIDGIEYIDSVDGSPAKTDVGFELTGFDFNLDAKPMVDISFPEIRREVTPDISVNVPDGDKDINIDGAEIGTLDKEGKGRKFKMPNLGISMPKVKGPKIDLSLSKKDVPEVKLPQAPQTGIKLASADVSIQEQKMEEDKPQLEKKPQETESELDGQGGKLKMPKFGIKMPKIKGPEFDLNLSKKDVDVKLPEGKFEVTLPEAAETDVTLGSADFFIPEQKMDAEKPELEMKPLETQVELDGQGSKFKMPKFGITMPKLKGPEVDLSLSKKDEDVTLSEAKGKVKLPDVELKESSAKMEVRAPEIKIAEKDAEGSALKFKMPSFKLPQFAATMPQISAEVSNKIKDIQVPETQLKSTEKGIAVDITTPEAGIVDSSSDVKTLASEFDGKGGKFKMPRFGISMPRVKGPEIDSSLSKKDVDVTLPEAGPKGKLAAVEVKAPETAVHQDVEGSSSKFQMPTFKLPKLAIGTPNLSVGKPDMDKDVQIEGAGINIPEEESAVDIAAPSTDVVSPSMDIKNTGPEHEGKGGKFKMPNLGFSMPNVKGPKVDLSLSKKDIDVTIPDAKVEVKLPKVDLGKTDVSIPEVAMDVKKPKLEMQALQTEGQFDGQGDKFKMPKLGIKTPKVKGPEIDLRLSKKDVDVAPQTEIETKLLDAPKIDLSLGKSDVELEEQDRKFKLPKFEMSMPQVKGPEFHLGLPKKDVDVTTSENKADINFPDVKPQGPSGKIKIKAPEIEVADGEREGSSSALKMPSLSFSMPKVKGPDMHLSLPKNKTESTLPETEAEVKFPEASKIDVTLGKAEVLIPEAKVEVKKPKVQIKPLQTDVELDGQGGKFKMPKFGITMPKVKGPEIDLNFSKKDVNVKLPEAKADVKLPEAPKIDVNLGKIYVSIPETKIENERPELEIQLPQSEGGQDGQGSKFKMPQFGISMPKVKGPDIDFSSSKTDVDVKLPETKAEVSLAGPDIKDPSAKVEIKAAEIEPLLGSMKGSPSKFKLPTFKFPKFGVTTPNISSEVPDADKDIKIDGADMHISVTPTDMDIPKVNADVHMPEVELKEPSGSTVIEQQPGGEDDAKPKKIRFSLPKFSFSKPSGKAPKVDASLQDVNVAIPEGKMDVKGGKVEMKPPECEEDVDGQESKFKMPKFGITMPKVTGPEIDLSLSKKAGDVTLPEAKVEVKLPDVKLEKPSAEVDIKAPEIKIATKDTDGSPSKFNMPTIKLPKFGLGTPSGTVDVPDMEKDVKIDGADIKIPEEILTVNVAAPSIDTDRPSTDMKITGTEHEGKGSKFKLPSLGISVPQAKGPNIDFSLSKKDVDVTLPEAKAEVKLPNVKLEKPSAEVDIKAPEIKVVTKDTDGSPSKFKMQPLKLPKFGISTQSGTVEMPIVDKDVKIDGADIKIPEEILTVNIAAPSIDTERPSIDMKNTGTEHEGKGSKFKLPSLGISVPQAKGPNIDFSLSKKDVDVTLPEAKAEVKLPDVELEKSSAEMEIKAPKMKVVKKDTDGSPSKFKMPTFKLPKFGLGTPSATIDVPDMEKDVKIDGADIKIPEEILTVNIAAPSIDTDRPSIDMKITGTEHEGKGSKFKLPSLGISVPQAKGPHIDFSLSKKDVDVTLLEAKAEVKLPDVKLEKPSAEVDIKAPDIDPQTGNVEGSPSKFKMPTFKLPKFGAATPQVSVEVPDMDKGIKVDGADIKLKDAKAEVKLPDVKIKEPTGSISIPQASMTEGDAKLKNTSWTMPKFSFSKTSSKAPEAEINLDVPKVDVAPSIDTEGPSIDMAITGTKHEGKGSKFKLPSLGISVPQAKGPEIDFSLSKKDVDVTLPEAKAEVKLPDVELEKPSAEMEIKAAKMKVVKKDTDGSPSKFKMPTFKLPKFGLGSPSATVDVPDMDKDVKIDGADIKIPEEILTVNITAPSIDTERPSIDMKITGIEHEGKESKFKLPSLGISVPQAKGPHIDFSLSKKDVDVTLPEAKAEVKLPDVKLEKPSAEVDIKAPDIDLQTGNVEGSPSKFKMPTFKLPKFGAATPQVSVEVPDMDKGIKVDGADIKLKDAKAEVKLPDVKIKEPAGSISIPQASMTEGDAKLKNTSWTMPKFSFSKTSSKTPEAEVNLDVPKVDVAPSIDTEGPSIDMAITGTKHEGKGSKFKLPSLGISVPQAKGPEIDFSLSKKDVDVTLPEAKAEVKLPDVELEKPSAEMEIKAAKMKVVKKDTDGSPSKFKMPTFKLPKFGLGSPSATVDVPDMDKDVKIDGADIKIPEEILTVNIAAPSIDTERPSIDMKITGTEHEGKGSKFKLPSLGISVPQAKGPEIDFSLSKKDVDVTLPEAKAEVKLPDVELEKPSAEMEIKAAKMKVVKKDTDGSPSKFKMPTFKLPKFGLGSPSATVDVPDMDKDVKIDGADIKIPEEILTVNIAAPSIDTERPSIDMKITGTEHEGKGSKFKLPSLGISVPQAKGPHIDFSLSKKDVDVTLPEAKAEVKLPDVKLEKPSAEVDIKAPDIDLQTGNVEGSPSKFKMPTFKLPKFGAATPQVSVEVPDMDKGIKVDGADIKLKDAKAEVKLPDVKIKEPTGSISIPQASMTEGDAKLKNTSWTMPKFSFSKTSSKAPEAEINLDVPKVDVAPSIDTEGPSIDMAITGTKHEGKGSKFKLPSLGISVPQAKGPEIDFSLSKKDVDVTLPEAKAEVKLPDVELEKSSAEMEIKAPKMKVVKKDTDGSPSKFKMPTFKLPKFGLGSPSATVDVPDMDKDVKIDGADIKIPEEILTVNITAPSIDTERPSIDMKITEIEHKGKESKFKLPSLGISVPQAKGPHIDFSLSKKDVDVTLPEAKAEVKLPDVKLEKPSAEVDIKAPDIDLQTGNVEGSPSKFKMPTFKLPKFGAATPQVSVEVPDMDKGIKVDGADIKLKDAKAEVKLPDVKIKEPAGSISIPQASMTEGDAKLKNTSWTMPKFSLSKTSSKAPEAEINLDVPKVDLTLPEVKTDVHLPDIDIKESSGISIEGGTAADFDAKLKKPRFSLPKFSFSKQSTKEPEVDASLPNLDVSLPEGNVEVKQPEIEFRPPQGEIELDGQESKFKIPKFGITMPKAKDLNVSKKDVDITLPEVKAEVKLPDVKTKQPSAKVEIKASEIEAQAGNVEVSPSKLKMTTITFPKFGAATPKVSVEVPDVEKDSKLDAEYIDVKAKGSELKGSEIKFKMPSFGISKKDIDVTLPEAKAEVELPNVEVKGAEGAVLESDASTIEVDAKLKRSNWTFPKFSFSRTGGKAPDVDVNLETPKVDVTSLEAKAEVGLPNVEVKGPSGAISVEEPPVAELDPNLKKTTFSMPRFSFSKSSAEEPEMGRGPPHADVSVPEGEVKGKHPEKEMKGPELEAGHDGHGSPFKLPKFGIVQQKGKGSEVDLNASQKDVDVKLPGVKAEVKLFKDEVKESSATVEMKTSETEAKSKDFGDSPSKFKMPTLKMQKFGSGSYDVTTEAPNAKKVVETEGTKLKEDVAVTIKVPSVDIKTDVSKPTISETPKAETAGVGHLSPSKFKLPSFKMPKLSFSNPKPVDEYVPVDTEYEEDQLEMGVELEGDSKSPKLTLTSFGEILKGTDVEFDGPKTDKDEETVEASEEVHEADEPTGKEKETNTKQEPIKSPERTGWFKFPRFSLSSPSEPPKIPEKGEQKDEKSPASETGDEDISPTSSVQSSDAFADISSTVTSEPVGLSLSSPTKVTVKYSDPNAATGLEEMHSSIITSTTRTELISVEPNLPEKITILSSGVSSSSEDTLRLESGKIHVITSNIQATPESQHARLLTDFQIKSAEGLPLKSEANEAASWTVEDSQSGMRAMFERHLVREASTERRESKETVVITKQITHVFDSSEPISGETASSIQRLRDSVHSDKMRFFDGAKK